jgi:hypothetical protein
MTPLPSDGVERPKFRIVCDYCGSLSIKVSDPANSPSTTVVRCGHCNAARGTLGELQELARSGKSDLFEF